MMFLNWLKRRNNRYWQTNLASRNIYLLLITKTNLAGAEKTAALKKRLETIAPDKNIYLATSVSTLPLQTQSDLMVFCAIGSPHAFLRDLELQGFRVRHKNIFKDHHSFSILEQRDLLDRQKELQTKYPLIKIVCTEKDLVKITNDELRKRVHVVGHCMQMNPQEKEDMIAQIRKSL